MTADTITEIKLELKPGIYRCDVCGSRTTGTVLAESEDGFRVCEMCLKAGNIDARLEEAAAALERRANALRERIGHLRLPSHAEYKKVAADAVWLDVFEYACDLLKADKAADRVLAAERVSKVLDDSHDEVPF